MYSFFRRATRELLENEVRAIRASLDGKWDLNEKFSLPGEGPAKILVDGLNQIFSRLVGFVTVLTRKSVEMATIAPLTRAISRKVLSSAESLSAKAEQIEGACQDLAGGIGRSSESANQALEQSSFIITEISQAKVLTNQAFDRMQAMGSDVRQLSISIDALDQRSRSIGSIIESISDIAENTGLLSLNAFIEAARAGEHGAGFSVISREIRQLSQETSSAAKEVKESLLAISELIKETVSAVSRVREGVGSGLQVSENATSALEKVSREHHRFHTHLESVISVVKDQKDSVALVSRDIATITSVGKEGISDSKRLAELAEKINLLTEEQLMATGIFILPQYRKAEADVVAMAKDPDIRALGGAVDEALHKRIRTLPYLELVYLTDRNGRQISSNIFRKEEAIVRDEEAKGKNWAQRPWFHNVIQKQRPFISDIYVSNATNSFCMTISTPVFHNSELVGVLGADINFEDLLNI